MTIPLFDPLNINEVRNFYLINCKEHVGFGFLVERPTIVPRLLGDSRPTYVSVLVRVNYSWQGYVGNNDYQSWQLSVREDDVGFSMQYPSEEETHKAAAVLLCLLFGYPHEPFEFYKRK